MTRKRLTREERKQETRQQLLDAGAIVFANHGLNGATVDKIAEEAGYTKGAFYAHFESKEGLFLSLFEAQLHAEVESIDVVMKVEPTMDQFITNMSGHFEEDWEKSRTWDMLKMEFMLYAMRDESVRQIFTDMVTKAIKSLENDLAPLLQDKDKAKLSAEQLVWTILSMQSGMALFRYTMGNAMPERLFENALRVILEPEKNVL